MSEQRVLPADVYDTLELSALAYDGIGANKWDENRGGLVPFCIGGHLDYSGIADAGFFTTVSLIFGSDIVIVNNSAVERINRRKRKDDATSRVSWKEYTRELNIVRGD